MTARHRTDLHVVLYGDVDANRVDGATIWLQSTALALAGLGLDRLQLVLKAPIDRRTIIGPLHDHPAIELVEPDDVLTSAGGAAVVAALAPDLVVVRGSRAAREMAGLAPLDGRLWTYLTDIAQHPLAMTEEERGELAEVVAGSELLLCQTDALRGHLETAVPAAAGRTALLPPMLPLTDLPQRSDRPVATPIRLVYAGKFAPRWRTLEMTRLPARLAAAGVPATVTFVGDKLHPDPEPPTWVDRMRRALQDTPDVEWIGALPRRATFDRLVTADIGLAWRDPALDASLELSTKLLEYGALGLPALVNRTSAHADLLGEDYPLFVADEDDVVTAVVACAADPSLHRAAAARLRAAAADHGIDRATGRFSRLLARRRPRPTVGPRDRVTRVLVAGHDLGFVTRIADFLGALPTVDVDRDPWDRHHRTDTRRSRRKLADADIVLCEWAGPAALWYAERVRPPQRLVVRLHRFELYTDWPRSLPMSRVHSLVCVDEHYRRMVLEDLGWPPPRVVTIPNEVDHLALDRPKLPDAVHRLGVVGMTPMRKRFDLAIEVLARLRRHDPRFSLVVKSRLATELPHVWDDPDERRFARDVEHRLRTDPAVRDAVHVDTYGPDVGHWLRRVGWVLSTSEDESFHLATAEGMASGAVPLVRDWPGATELYGPDLVHGSLDGLVETVLEGARGGAWRGWSREVRTRARRWDLPAVARRFEALLLG